MQFGSQHGRFVYLSLNVRKTWKTIWDDGQIGQIYRYISQNDCAVQAELLALQSFIPYVTGFTKGIYVNIWLRDLKQALLSVRKDPQDPQIGA